MNDGICVTGCAQGRAGYGQHEEIGAVADYGLELNKLIYVEVRVWKVTQVG